MRSFIPSRNRSGIIGDKALRLFPDATLCVGDDEVDAYAKVSGNLLVHPADVVGIGPLAAVGAGPRGRSVRGDGR